MAGKLRVHELAKQLGVTSKELLATLKEQGEFVKTASSTVEAPVVRKMRKHYGVEGSGSKSGGDATQAKSKFLPALQLDPLLRRVNLRQRRPVQNQGLNPERVQRSLA